MTKMLNFEFLLFTKLKIQLLNIVKEYKKGTKAVDDVSFEAMPNEFLVLVGPSGCGKSTILRMIAGLEDIGSGQLLFNDKLMNDIEPGKRNIGMVFQNYALYPHLTVAENLAFPLKIQNKSDKIEISKRVKDISEIIGLNDLLDRRPKQLSGGQRQRVALGRALIRKPDIFLFDEPLSNLDAKLRVQMRNEIINLHYRAETTSVYVTHDQTEAMTMGNRIAVLNDGKLMQIGTPDEVYNTPADVFTAGFLGSPQMNFFDVTISDKDLIIKGQKFETGMMINPEIRTLGIRPEHIEIDNKTPDFVANIERIEFLGYEQLIYAEVNELDFCIRTGINIKYHAGENIPVKFNRENLHFFNTHGTRI